MIEQTLLESNKLNPSSLLELFILDGTAINMINREPGNDGKYFFHGGTNGIYSPIIFNGYTYYSFPLESSDFQFDGKGSLPRPRIKLANINGYLSNLIINNQNLIGAKVIRKRVYARFLDAENFPNNTNPYGTPNPEGAFTDEIFYVNRKVSEDRFFVEFELASQLEMDKVTLPSRKIISNICLWKYRGEGCMYGHVPVADAANKRFREDYGLTLSDQGEWNSSTSYSPGNYVYIVSTLDNNYGERFFYVCKSAAQGLNDDPRINQSKWVADVCSKSLKGCRLRFGSNFLIPLPFGGFPGASRLPY